MNHLLGRIFVQRRNRGGTDLEAIESALRLALHQAGASALSELLQFESAGAGPASVALCLWSLGAIPGTPLTTRAYCGGLGANAASVVSVRRLP
jgi:hypothetical protein